VSLGSDSLATTLIVRELKAPAGEPVICPDQDRSCPDPSQTRSSPGLAQNSSGMVRQAVDGATGILDDDLGQPIAIDIGDGGHTEARR
jgi:hypothetical protein